MEINFNFFNEYMVTYVDIDSSLFYFSNLLIHYVSQNDEFALSGFDIRLADQLYMGPRPHFANFSSFVKLSGI